MLKVSDHLPEEDGKVFVAVFDGDIFTHGKTLRVFQGIVYNYPGGRTPSFRSTWSVESLISRAENGQMIFLYKEED